MSTFMNCTLIRYFPYSFNELESNKYTVSQNNRKFLESNNFFHVIATDNVSMSFFHKMLSILHNINRFFHFPIFSSIEHVKIAPKKELQLT